MVNRAVLVGRMMRDPELRRTLQGDAVTSFTLAVNRNFTSRDGQQQADFISRHHNFISITLSDYLEKL